MVSPVGSVGASERKRSEVSTGDPHPQRVIDTRCRFERKLSIQFPCSLRYATSSSQATYHSFPCKHEQLFIPLFLLSQKSLSTFRGPRNFYFFCRSTQMQFLPRSHTAALLCSFPKRSHRTVISHSAGHSLVTDFWATKKSRYINAYRPIQKDRLIHCGFGITLM